MGWSCTQDAGNTLNKMSDKCYANSGSTNVWKVTNGNKYMYELPNKEHADGHISAPVYKFIGGTGLIKRSGSIYINPNGSVRSAPKFLKV